LARHLAPIWLDLGQGRMRVGCTLQNRVKAGVFAARQQSCSEGALRTVSPELADYASLIRHTSYSAVRAPIPVLQPAQNGLCGDAADRVPQPQLARWAYGAPARISSGLEGCRVYRGWCVRYRCERDPVSESLLRRREYVDVWGASIGIIERANPHEAGSGLHPSPRKAVVNELVLLPG
jgi:hypothetical protein